MTLYAAGISGISYLRTAFLPFLPQQSAPLRCDTRGGWTAPSLAISEETPRPKSGPSLASCRRKPPSKLPAPSGPHARLALVEAGSLAVLCRCRHLPLLPARLFFPTVVGLSSRWVVSGGELAEERNICIGAGDSREGDPESPLETADDCAIKGARKSWCCAMRLAGARGGTHLLLALVIWPLATHPFRDGAPLLLVKRRKRQWVVGICPLTLPWRWVALRCSPDAL